MNSKLIERTIFGEYEILLIQTESGLWLKLGYLNRQDLQQFWQTEESVEISFAHSLVDSLVARLAQFPLEDATLFFPPNWTYWGGGIPKPLLTFLRSDNFKKQFQQIKAKNYELLSKTI